MGIDGINGNNGINNANQNVKIFQDGNKNKKDSSSIFGDKNNNGIIDKNDFADAKTAELANEKGLIGRTWESLNGTFEKLLNSNKPEEGLTREPRYNVDTQENYQADIKDGLEIRRTYYKEDGSVDEILNRQFDENGNLTRNVSVDGEGNLRYATDVKDNKVVKYTEFKDDGTVNLEIEYDEAGKAVHAKEYKDGYTAAEDYDADGKAINKEITYTGDIPAFADGDMSSVAKAMNEARNKLPIGSRAGSLEFDRVINQIFGDELQSIDTMRDGGSLEITLNDGSLINMNNAIMIGDGSVTITKPDGTVEKYSAEGEKIE